MLFMFFYAVGVGFGFGVVIIVCFFGVDVVVNKLSKPKKRVRRLNDS